MAGNAAFRREVAGDGDVARASLAIVAADGAARRGIVELLGTEDLEVGLEGATPEVLAESGHAPQFAAVVVQPVSTRHGPVGAIRRIHELLPGAPIVVIVAPARDHDVRRALAAGADGVVLLSQVDRSLAATVRAVLAGQTVLPSELRHHAERPALSYREKQVLGMVVTGATNREIADALFLAESTVKGHLASAFQKLGVRSRAEAAAVVIDRETLEGQAIEALSRQREPRSPSGPEADVRSALALARGRGGTQREPDFEQNGSDGPDNPDQ